jgi:hypothetical protein
MPNNVVYPPGTVLPFPEIGGSASQLPMAAFDAVFHIGPIQIGSFDAALLVLCPLFTALGTLVSFILKNKNEDQIQIRLGFFYRVTLSVVEKIGHIFVGLVLGLIIAVFVVGAVKPEVTSLTRILALSILLGFQAPAMWFYQERIITNLIEKQLEKIIRTKLSVSEVASLKEGEQ